MTRPLRRLALLAVPAVLLTVARPAFAVDPNRTLTQYVHRIWQMQQGLPQATIYAILQDARGYLWLGTQSGLVRFDGVRFTTIGAAALRDAWIQSLTEDRQGNLWVGTNGDGLVRVRDGSVVDGPPAKALGSNVRVLLVDRNGNLWVSADGTTIVTLTPAGNLLRRTGPSFAMTRVDAACEAEDGTIWIGGDSSELSVWNGAGFARYHLRSVPAAIAVQTMTRTSDGSLWIGTSAGLVQVADGRERLYTVKDGLADNSVLALEESREGGLWVGTKNGFSRLRPGDIERFGTSDGLSQSTVSALFEDREGSFWVGTKHGLNQFLDGRTIPYTTNEGLPSNNTGPVLQDVRSTIWVGTLDAGIGRYADRRFTTLTRHDGLVSDSVRALAQDATGDMWVGTNAGLNRVHEGRIVRTYTTAQRLPSNDIRSLFFDRSSGLWIGTANGLASIRDGRVEAPAEVGELGRSAIVALGGDDRGRVLAAVQGGGVYRIAPAAGGARRVEEIEEPNGSIRAVDAFYVDPDGRLWMGTIGNGLWLVEQGRAVSYSMRDGLFDDEIFGIAADDAGRLWMACSKGIFSVNRSDLLAFAAGNKRTVISTPYSPTDALRTIECRAGVQPAVWRMRDGRIWFATIRGVIVIDPNHLDRRLPPPSVVVEDVTVNGQRRQPQDVGRLEAGSRNIEFNYTALSFIVPGRITFRYLLDGFDRDWTNADTRREAFYTNLPPGPFRFRVIACNIDGRCAEARRPIAFSIAPHLYQRLWFLPASVVLAMLLVWIAYRLRVRRLRAQFAIVLAERNRIARELHDTLIQGFSGITMQLQALVGRLSGTGERREVEEIISEAGWCLREARRSLAGLRNAEASGPELATAIANAARQQTEGKDVRLKMHVDRDLPELPAATGYNLVRIAREAIANALQHGSPFTIDVSLAGIPGAVRLSIADDGAGFEGDASDYAQLGHYGLVGMRERAEEIGATFEVSSGVDRGTTVTVTVPVGADTPARASQG